MYYLILIILDYLSDRLYCYTELTNLLLFLYPLDELLNMDFLEYY